MVTLELTMFSEIDCHYGNVHTSFISIESLVLYQGYHGNQPQHPVCYHANDFSSVLLFSLWDMVLVLFDPQGASHVRCLLYDMSYLVYAMMFASRQT